jgi:hypothetical protein
MYILESSLSSGTYVRIRFVCERVFHVFIVTVHVLVVSHDAINLEQTLAGVIRPKFLPDANSLTAVSLLPTAPHSSLPDNNFLTQGPRVGSFFQGVTDRDLQSNRIESKRSTVFFSRFSLLSLLSFLFRLLPLSSLSSLLSLLVPTLGQ